MKLAIRIFAMSVVLAGLSAASVSSATLRALPSHLSATASDPDPQSLPIPLCGPWVPCQPPVAVLAR
jgi:hypothetical protein